MRQRERGKDIDRDKDMDRNRGTDGSIVGWNLMNVLRIMPLAASLRWSVTSIIIINM